MICSLLLHTMQEVDSLEFGDMLNLSLRVRVKIRSKYAVIVKRWKNSRGKYFWSYLT